MREANFHFPLRLHNITSDYQEQIHQFTYYFVVYLMKHSLADFTSNDWQDV
jgi:hypothetical protein